MKLKPIAQYLLILTAFMSISVMDAGIQTGLVELKAWAIVVGVAGAIGVVILEV